MSTENDTSQPKLQKRFRRPDNWHDSYLDIQETNHRLHYGFSAPTSKEPEGVIVLLQGLQEFTEKYYETARFFIEKGFAVVLFDWHYQGRSGRLKSNPHKRHSDGFEKDLIDLKTLLDEVVRKEFPDKAIHFLAHSTGGNLAMRYAIQNPEEIRTIGISAPLLGIYGLNFVPKFIMIGLLTLLLPFHKQYVPGGGNWSEDDRASDGSDKFSSDPMRDSITNKWYLHDPSLQGGSPTLGWLYHAYKSMKFLRKESNLKQIKSKLFFAVAAADTIVDPNALNKIIQYLPAETTVIKMENCKHEILQELDPFRDAFLYGFLKKVQW